MTFGAAVARGRSIHRGLYGGRAGGPDEIIRFGPTDFAAIARAFGIEGIRVERPEEIAPALGRALAMDAPVVVDVATDPAPRAPEPWSPR